MPLTLQEVEHIAKLARLELTADEKARYREQLSAILDHVAQLQKLDTSAISPTASVFSGDSRRSAEPFGAERSGRSDSRRSLRVDESRPGLPREVLLKNAPEQEKGQFKIPPVFE